MTTPTIKMVKMYQDVQVPEYAHDGDSGFDLHAYLRHEPIACDTYRIGPHKTVLLKTGLQMAIPEGYEGQVRSRSGMSKRGLVVANSPGTVDSGYRGEIGVLLLNTTDMMQFIQHGDRIAQMVIAPVSRADIFLATSLDETERGEGGFGSTGE